MTIDQFWDIVERVHAASPNDMKRKCELLGDELRCIGLEEITAFGNHFGECFQRADTWDIWGAAVIICGGISDDSFMDFCSTLISLGRKPFEAALTDTDALSQFEIDPKWAHFEGYQYVPGKIYKEMGGPEPECDCPQCQPNKVRLPPPETKGTYRHPWELASHFPKLAAKYGFKDSDWHTEKLRHEKALAQNQASLKTANFLLESGIIPECGLIPPFQIVNQIMKSGQFNGPAGKRFAWEPCEFDQGHYWSTVMLLGKLAPADKVLRPELQNLKLEVDVNSHGVATYEEWIRNLESRGLA